ncbi:MAG: histidinol dehydrogenase, partial [Rhodobiaceae bacterium]|nr:histidinol dehydrogenase [Rhodobiaceae bacterium]
MVLRLDSRAGDFEARFAEFLAAKREVSEDVDAVVRDIIARVRAEGDAALIDLSLKFDLADLAATGIRVSADEIDAAVAGVDRATLEALEFAYRRIRAH